MRILGRHGITTIAIVVVAVAVAVVSREHPTMLGCALAMTCLSVCLSDACTLTKQNNRPDKTQSVRQIR